VSTIFAKNTVIARSIFFKLLSKQHKIKSSHGEILKIEEVEQDSDFVIKNYGISFIYRTRTGLQNAYKEFRHVNTVCAISALHQEFGSRHKVKHTDIYIISIKKLADNEVTKPKTLTYAGADVMYPVFLKISNTNKTFVPTTQNILE